MSVIITENTVEYATIFGIADSIRIIYMGIYLGYEGSDNLKPTVGMGNTDALFNPAK